MKTTRLIVPSLSCALLVGIGCGGPQPPEQAPEEATDPAPASPSETSEPSEPSEPADPPCQGQDCFGDYQPKTSPDTLADFAPQVIGRVDGIAAADLDGLPALIHALADARAQAQKNPGTVREGNVILGADPEEYVPSEQELLECAIGDRIAEVIAGSDGKKVAAALKKAGIKKRSLSYGKIEVWHVDVMGSGRFFYASKPAPIELRLPR